MKLIVSFCILCFCFSYARSQDTQNDNPPKGVKFSELLKISPDKSTENGDDAPQFSTKDECGDQASESQLYDFREGKVIKVLSATTILFQQVSLNGNVKEDELTVRLVGIDSEVNKTAVENKLRNILLNSEVRVIGNLLKKKDKRFGGVVWLLGDNEDIDDVGMYLLETGTAKYKPFESANLVSMVMPCRLEKAEEKARKAKIGIWAN